MTSEPIRVLHVFGRMGVGGAEMWLMNAFRRIDRERFRFDFLVHRARAGEFDDEIRSLGGAIHTAPSFRNPARYPLEMRRVLRAGRYHIAHSHVSHFSGYVLPWAQLFGVQGRIAHSHTSVPGHDDPPLRRAYKRAMRRSIHHNATLGLGCSSQACASLFGFDWQQHDKYRVLFYGYDFERFSIAGDETRARCRAELGITPDQRVVGHIGRFVTPKNHEFIIELATAARDRGTTDHRYVLVGDGELRPRIERMIAERSLGDMVILTGQRRDIPALSSSFDVMIQPSLWEGFGVTILEAQAVGVPCVVSDQVTREVEVHPGAVTWLSLEENVAPWLDAIDAALARPRMPPARALARMRESPFSIETHVAHLQALYESQVGPD